jgi:hypothetical protein
VLYNKHYEEKEDDFSYRTICWLPRPKRHQISCQNRGKDLVPLLADKWDKERRRGTGYVTHLTKVEEIRKACSNEKCIRYKMW